MNFELIEKCVGDMTAGNEMDRMVYDLVLDMPMAVPQPISNDQGLAFHLFSKYVHGRGWPNTTMTPPAHKQDCYIIYLYRADHTCYNNTNEENHFRVTGETVEEVECKAAIILALREKKSASGFSTSLLLAKQSQQRMQQSTPKTI